MKKAFLKMLTTMIISAFLLSLTVYVAHAQMPILSVKPPTIIDLAKTPGTTFIVNCSIDDVDGLFAWQIELFFNPAVLNCTTAFYPSDHVFAGKAFIPITPVIDNTAGYVLHAATLIGTAAPFSGDGTLCQIEFKVKSTGKSDLNYSRPLGGDTFLWDSDLNDISATVQDGFFSNMPPTVPPVASFDYSPKPPLVNQTITFDASASYDLDGTIVSYGWNFGDGETGAGEIVTHTFDSPGIYDVNLTVTDDDALTDSTSKSIQVFTTLPAKLYIDPPEIIDPMLLPPAIVEVNVTVDDIQNMYGYYFKLGYNTGMLTCIGIMINRVQNETHMTPKISIDDEIGLIKINVTYYSPAVPITSFSPLALVTLTFQVDSVGSSILDLYDTKLTDPTGAPIAHEVQDGLIMTLIRDVAVTNVAPENSWVYAGWVLNVIVTVKNLGNISETFDVKAYYDSNLIGTKTVLNLAPDAETVLVFLWNTTGVSEGNYTLKAEAMSVPFELNTANNVFVDGEVTVLTIIRDVAIVDVITNRSWVYQGWIVNITVVAKNLGMIDENFTVKSFYDGNLIGEYTVVNLPTNDEITIVFSWNTSTVTPCHNYTISAEASLLPFEYNTSNNVLVNGAVKVRLMCDVDGDGKIDMKDVAATSAAFGSFPGHPRWNPDVDFNLDGKVDMKDISLVARKFGTSC